MPSKYQRFNEEVDTQSSISTKERRERAKSLLSTQNLAAFVKDRPTLKVMGTPNFNSTSVKAYSRASNG